jgi:hypothetical protein
MVAVTSGAACEQAIADNIKPTTDIVLKVDLIATSIEIPNLLREYHTHKNAAVDGFCLTA